MENQMERASTAGKMELTTAETSRMDSNTATGSGVVREMDPNKILLTASISKTKNRGRAILFGLQATGTKEITRMTSVTATVKCTGPMGLATKVNGVKAYSMGVGLCATRTVRKNEASLRITSTKGLRQVALWHPEENPLLENNKSSSSRHSKKS